MVLRTLEVELAVFLLRSFGGKNFVRAAAVGEYKLLTMKRYLCITSVGQITQNEIAFKFSREFLERKKRPWSK